MNDWLGILWLVILLAVNAFFVASEFAVVSARRSQIEPRAEAGGRGAKAALWAMEHATLMLATTQLGITVCSLLILNVSEPAIHHLLQAPLQLTGWSATAIDTVSFVITLVIVSFLHVVLGEMVPKNLSFSMPDRAVLLLAPALTSIARPLRPIIVALNAMANGVVRLAGIEPKDEAASTFTLEEVRTIVAQSRREGVLDDASGTLRAAFEFTGKTAADTALPLESVIALPADASPADLERAVSRHGFSRYLIVEGADPLGYLHLKDVLDLEVGDGFEQPIPSVRVRQLVSVLADTELEDALSIMRRSGVHLARVFEPGGATTGILFLEDIIEELVGEVQDATRRS